MKNCPLCQNDNQCAVAKGHQPETCWCMVESFPKGLLASPSLKDSCICRKCVDDFKKVVKMKEG